jgi:sugar phosphate permease
MRIKSWQPWLFWFLGASFFFFEYFARVDPSGMLAQLQHYFNLDNKGLGILSAYFYIPYVLMQIPVGLLVDRHGPRRWLAVAALVSAVGAIVFSFSVYLWQAKFGRMLIGLGASFAFVGTLRLATLWFDRSRLGFFAGMTQGVGMLGAAAGVGVMPVLIESWGWQKIMLSVGVLLAIFALMILIFVRDKNPDKASVNKEALTTDSDNFLTGARAVFTSGMSWLNALYAGLLYAPTAALGELWGTRFFHHVYGFSSVYAAIIMACIFIGWAIGGPVAGWLSDRFQQRKGIMILSVCASWIILTFVFIMPHMSIPMMCVCMFFYGVFNFGVALAYAVAGELHSSSSAGVSIAFTNMFSIVVGASLQPIMGWLVDVLKPYHTDRMTYFSVMWILPICLILSLLCVLFLKERVQREVDND